MCECWTKKGVIHKGRMYYVCAGCGNDVSESFMMLTAADCDFADYLIDKGDDGLRDIKE